MAAVRTATLGGADAVAADGEAPERIARARSGDRAAQRLLFECWRGPIYNYLRQMARDDELAADLTQETFVRAYRHLPRLRHEAAFRAWLFQIAHNLVRDRVAGAATVALDEDDPAYGPDPHGDGARQLERAELAAHVGRAVAALSPEHREVVVLHHFEALEVEEIARLLRVRPGTVKSRLARAREQLRRRLAPYVEDS